MTCSGARRYLWWKWTSSWRARGAININLADEIVVKEAFRRAGIEFGPEGVLLRTKGRD